MAFLVQMRQSNKYGSVRNGEVINLHLVSGTLESASLPPAKHQPRLLIPSTQTINKEKTKNPEMRSNFQQIVLYCLVLHTQKPRLREVHMESNPKRGGDKINIE